MKKKFVVGDWLLLVTGILCFLLLAFVFTACDPMEDGHFMTCHWAGEAVKGLSWVFLALAVLHCVFNSSEVKTGLAVSIFPVGILSMLVPGRLISLCMMDDMRCHTVMTPGVIVCSVLMMAAAAIDLFFLRKRPHEV